MQNRATYDSYVSRLPAVIDAIDEVRMQTTASLQSDAELASPTDQTCDHGVTQRILYMDAMRSVLMMLGVVLHSAQVFNPSQDWLIHSSQTSGLAHWVVEIIHVFRMPAFFVISGFFCALTLGKYGARGFLQRRLARIAIPIVATALSLNIVESMVLDQSGWLHFSWTNYFVRGGWVSHLWFLNNLLVYFVLFAVCSGVLGQKIRAVVSHQAKKLGELPSLALMLVLPFLSILVLATNKLGFPLYEKYLGFIDTFSLMKNLVYFGCGFILCVDRRLLEKFCSISFRDSLVLFLGSLIVSRSLGHLADGLRYEIASAYCQGIMVWSSVAIVFACFSRYFDQPSKRWRYLSEASYTVYLFHHVLVILMGILLIQFSMPPLFAMAIQIVSVLFITLAIHRLIVSRFPIARLLFNGRG